LGFDVLDNPEEYQDKKDIVLYWGLKAEPRLGFIDQWDIWRRFCCFQ
jgi:hypothetical protein